MILSTHPSYPAARTFVLKLHRDAEPSRISGRLENVSTGEQFAFATTKELLRLLAEECATRSMERR